MISADNHVETSTHIFIIISIPVFLMRSFNSAYLLVLRHVVEIWIELQMLLLLLLVQLEAIIRKFQCKIQNKLKFLHMSLYLLKLVCKLCQLKKCKTWTLVFYCQ